jgi:hypothetical protein
MLLCVSCNVHSRCARGAFVGSSVPLRCTGQRSLSSSMSVNLRFHTINLRGIGDGKGLEYSPRQPLDDATHQEHLQTG